jgi:hypothetical protein
MHPQLEAIIDEFRQAQSRLAELARTVPATLWGTRPAPDSWCVAECVAHLNLTSHTFLPHIRDGLRRARDLSEPAPRRYRRDPLGWLLWRTMGPPVRLRIRTAASFVPETTPDPGALVREFEDLQREQIECVAEGDGLPLTRVRIASPFDERVRYNLYSCLSFLPRHQLRHLWQAERAASALSRPSAA